MNIIATALEYLPLILQGIVTVEAAMKGAPGQTKASVVLSTIHAAATEAGQVPEPHVQAASVLMTSIVDALNKTGWFTHKQQPTLPGV